eukprot:scaffold89556_cov23-Tisochrysis_lutea.AAC.2
MLFSTDCKQSAFSRCPLSFDRSSLNSRCVSDSRRASSLSFISPTCKNDDAPLGARCPASRHSSPKPYTDSASELPRSPSSPLSSSSLMKSASRRQKRSLAFSFSRCASYSSRYSSSSSAHPAAVPPRALADWLSSLSLKLELVLGNLDALCCRLDSAAAAASSKSSDSLPAPFCFSTPSSQSASSDSESSAMAPNTTVPADLARLRNDLLAVAPTGALESLSLLPSDATPFPEDGADLATARPMGASLLSESLPALRTLEPTGAVVLATADGGLWLGVDLRVAIGL